MYKFDNTMNSYLAGVFEADGHIDFIKNKNPRFCITTHEKKVNQETLEELEKDAQFYQTFLRKKILGQTYRSNKCGTGRTELPPF